MSSREKMIDLMVMLRKIWDDRDFVLGVCAQLKSDEHIQIMMDWLNKHKLHTLESDEVIVKALEIRHDKKLEVNGVTTRD